MDKPKKLVIAGAIMVLFIIFSFLFFIPDTASLPIRSGAYSFNIGETKYRASYLVMSKKLDEKDSYSASIAFPDISGFNASSSFGKTPKTTFLKVVFPDKSTKTFEAQVNTVYVIGPDRKQIIKMPPEITTYKLARRQNQQLIELIEKKLHSLNNQ